MKTRLTINLLLATMAGHVLHAQPVPPTSSAHDRIEQMIAPLGTPSTPERHVGVESIIYQPWNGSTWVFERQRAFAYDGLQRHEEWTFNFNGSSWVNDSRTTFAPYAATRHLPSLVEVWNPVRMDFEPAEQYLYTLTGSGAFATVHEEIQQDWEHTRWTNRARITYTYMDGTFPPILTGIKTDIWSGNDWDPVEQTVVSEAPNRVLQTTQYWNGTAWVDTERLSFPGQTLQTLQTQLQKFERRMADYGDLNYSLVALPDFIAQEWDGFTWVTTEQKVSETFDPTSGEPTQVSYQAWMGNGWLPVWRHTVRYEGVARPQALIIEIFDGINWTPFFTETYLYNTKGDLVKAEQQADDGGGMTDLAWYHYRWKDLITHVETEAPLGRYALDPAYPNPFNPTTRLAYHLAAPGPVSVRAYDTLGRLVATLVDGPQAAGPHEALFEASTLPSGVYLVRLEAPGFQQTRMVTLLK